MSFLLKLVTRICLAFVCLLWSGALAVQAADHYVVPPGTPTTHTDPYDGWGTAGTNIIEVVNAAMTNTMPRMVYVTNGEYCLTNQIMMTNIITVRSFSGNYSNTLVYAGWPTYTNRCFYVANTGIVDGFTISNGHLTGSNDNIGGAGAFVTNNGIMRNCYFVNNVCSNKGVSTGGGGVYVSGGGIISNCIFFANDANRAGAGHYTAGQGGGVRVNTRGSVLDCTVISNTAYNGGGILLAGNNYYEQVASNCWVAHNTGRSAGGILTACGIVVDCVISNNHGTYSGVSGSYSEIKNCRIVNNNGSCCALRLYYSMVASNCTISGNLTEGDVDAPCGAGGVFIDGSGGSTKTNNMYNCIISNNLYYTKGSGSGGLTISLGGQVRNCLINNNTNIAPNCNGGGVFLTNSALYINIPYGLINCTIVNNYSTNEGGGIAAIGPSNYIANCIVVGNSSSSNNFPNIYNTEANSNNYWYSCATGVVFAPNQGNITNDPMFKDPNAGNYRLQANSPCVNKGTNQNWMTNSFDLDGRIRIRYGRVDMGAYETIYKGVVYKFH